MHPQFRTCQNRPMTALEQRLEEQETSEKKKKMMMERFKVKNILVGQIVKEEATR